MLLRKREYIEKVDFRKGSATLIFGYMIMLICLFVALVLIEQYARYDNALTTQMGTDSIADGTAVYASTLSGYDDDEMYQMAQDRAQQISDLISDEYTSTYLDDEGLAYTNNFTIDENDFADDKVTINYTTNNIEYARLESFDNSFDDGTPGQNYYTITRKATTIFTRGYGGGGNQDWVSHIYDVYYNYMLTGPDYQYGGDTSTFEFDGRQISWRHDCSGTVSAFLLSYGEINEVLSTQSMPDQSKYSTFSLLRVGSDITSVNELVPGDILLDPATHTQIITTVSEYNESTQSVSIGGFNFGSGTVSTMPYSNIVIRNSGNSFNTMAHTFTYVIRAPENSGD